MQSDLFGEGLDRRIAHAHEFAKKHGTSAILLEFLNAMQKSVAVLACSLSRAAQLIASDNNLISTFYNEVSSSARLPEDNEWDRIRQTVDVLFFPYYEREIRFAGLSLNGSGIPGYGQCFLTFKEAAIRARSTVFHENTIVFAKKNNLGPSAGVPPGFKAPWDRRQDLVGAKLYDKLTPTTCIDSFQSLLISGPKTDSDFVEVHIFGPLNRHSTASILLPACQRKADKALACAIKESAGNFGIPCKYY